MSEFQDTNLKVIVATANTAATETTLSAFANTGSVGEVIAVEADGTATAAGSDKIVIVSKLKDGTLDMTEAIPTARITRASVLKYSAPVTQVDYIGFNGTTGAIDEIANNLYQVNMEIQNAGSLSQENVYLKHAHYKSTASVSQEGVAEGLVDSFIRNFSREPLERRPKFEVVNSNAGAALGTGVDDVTFTKGSKFFTATDIDDATTNDALAVGDWIRIGTAVTDPIYRITAIDTTTNVGTLAVPFQGETATIADTGLEKITAANVAAGDCGVKITGWSELYKLGIDRFDVPSWRLQLVGFTNSAITLAAKAKLGNGAGKRVKDKEWFARGNFGDIYRLDRMSWDPYAENLESSITANYHTLSIHYHELTELVQDVTVPRTVQVFVDAGAGTDYTNVNKLIDLLNNVTSSGKLAALSALS